MQIKGNYLFNSTNRCHMKPKILLLAVSLVCFVVAKANNNETWTGQKDDLSGIVFHGESKKPLKDVCVTAYLVSKKEKVTVTDDEGFFFLMD